VVLALVFQVQSGFPPRFQRPVACHRYQFSRTSFAQFGFSSFIISVLASQFSPGSVRIVPSFGLIPSASSPVRFDKMTHHVFSVQQAARSVPSFSCQRRPVRILLVPARVVYVTLVQLSFRVRVRRPLVSIPCSG